MVMKTITTTSSSLKRNKEGGWNLNTDLCVDVKTFLRTDRITQLGKDYAGVLTRDAEDIIRFLNLLSHRQSNGGMSTSTKVIISLAPNA
jgi:hypothetical protein